MIRQLLLILTFLMYGQLNAQSLISFSQVEPFNCHATDGSALFVFSGLTSTDSMSVWVSEYATVEWLSIDSLLLTDIEPDTSSGYNWEDEAYFLVEVYDQVTDSLIVEDVYELDVDLIYSNFGYCDEEIPNDHCDGGICISSFQSGGEPPYSMYINGSYVGTGVVDVWASTDTIYPYGWQCIAAGYVSFSDANGCWMISSEGFNTHNVANSYSFVNEPTWSIDTVTICPGDTLVVGGIPRWEPGSYKSYSRDTSSNCQCGSNDTVIVFDSATIVLDTFSICQGDSMFLEGQYRTTAGIYYDTVSGNGCDSVFQAILMVDQLVDTQHVFLCEGDSILLVGEWHSNAGFVQDSVSGYLSSCDTQGIIYYQIHLSGGNNTTIETIHGGCEGSSWSYYDIFTNQWYSPTWTGSSHWHNVNTPNGYCSFNHQVNLVQDPIYTVEAEQLICIGDTFHFQGQSYFSDTTIIFTDQSTQGCDSSGYINLMVRDTLETIVVNDCDYYVSTGGNTYTTSGTYFESFTNTADCDSTVILELTIDTSVSTTLNVVNCNAYFWPLTSVTYYSNGVHTVVLSNQSGCDSIVTLDLVINSESYASIEDTACDFYIWPITNQLYSNSGAYTGYLPNQFGCDSIITLNLEIESTTLGTAIDTSCDSYNWTITNQTYTNSGIYSGTLVNLAGCDSIIELDLEILHSTSLEIDTSSCFEFTSLTSNQTWSSSGDYYDTLVNSVGCDSVVHYDLIVYQVDTVVNANSQQTGLVAQANPATYQWLNCDSGMTPIPGETNQYYINFNGANVAVEVTQNGCVDTSACAVILGVGVDKPLPNELTVFPNPSEGMFTVDLGETYSDILYRVYNVAGQLIESNELRSSKRFEVTIEGASGAYILEIETEGGVGARVQLFKE